VGLEALPDLGGDGRRDGHQLLLPWPLRRSHFAGLYPEVPLATVNSLCGCDITRRMQHPVHDEELSMEEAAAAIRQAMTDEEVGQMTLAPAEPRTSREQAGSKPIPEAGLLSRQATAAVGSAFNTLTKRSKFLRAGALRRSLRQ